VVINCGAMAEDLLDVELFGRVTQGTDKALRGLFLNAEGGTLLLDEVGELPVRLQIKLLRALQENMIRPVGSADGIPVNVRVI